MTGIFTCGFDSVCAEPKPTRRSRLPHFQNLFNRRSFIFTFPICRAGGLILYECATSMPCQGECLYNAHLRILISAGEASGEMYGAQLIEALKGRDPSLDFFGVGGERMRAAGCNTVVDAKDLSVVGITEILSHLPKIYGLYRHLIAEAGRRKPDLAIVIDSPAFNWRVAREMKKRGIPVVYYVAPQFWAWRQGRVRLLRNFVDKAFVIFPFEEKFYCDRGVDATFVGHPLAELPLPTVSRDQYAAELSLDA